MLVVVSGRKSSGKTTIAKYLSMQGFKRASFAARLKRLVGQLYGWSSEDLNSEAGKESLLPTPVEWDRDKAAQLADIINAVKPLNSVPKTFVRRREALQHIGTDVLRDYDRDFHVNAFREDMMAGDGHHVVDDCRFQNELEVCRELGCLDMFVIRPSVYEYGNHPSESELRRQNFCTVVINDSSVHDMLDNVAAFLRKCKVGAYAVKYGTVINRNSTKLMDCDPNRFSLPTNDAAYLAGVISKGGKLSSTSIGTMMSIEVSSVILSRYFADVMGYVGDWRDTCKNKCYYFQLNDPFMLEDLKLWGQRPGGHGPDELPFLIKDDYTNLCFWMAGYLDACLAPGGMWPARMALPGGRKFLEQLQGVFGVGGDIEKCPEAGASHFLLYTDEDASLELSRKVQVVAGRQLDLVRRYE